MKQLNQKDAIHYIATRQEFKASALSGEFKTYTPSTGRLDSEESAKLALDFSRALDAYVVFSYGTPVAWFTAVGGWYVVSQKFSVTTSKHQTYTKRAIADSLAGVN
jgi:hypothetical protein